MGGISRHEFIALLGGAAAWPMAARAQQPRLPVVGFLRSTSAADSVHLVAAFRQGLKEAGFVEGQSVAIEFRWADGNLDRLPALASDLVRRQSSVIVVNNAAIPAAKAATTTIPIVFASGGDPVQDGSVASLNRPGGNVTGASFLNLELAEKRLGLLRELAPNASVIASLRDPNITDTELRTIESTAIALGLQILIANAASERDFDTAFATFVRAGAGALLVGGVGFLTSHRRQIVALAARHAIPTIYGQREYVDVGGLMSYGASQADAYRRAGGYVARILKGEKPGELPVDLPTKFELVINLGTAKALGLALPPGILAIADEVIE